MAIIRPVRARSGEVVEITWTRGEVDDPETLVTRHRVPPDPVWAARRRSIAGEVERRSWVDRRLVGAGLMAGVERRRGDRRA